MEKNNLLPCPFCDNEVEFHPQEHHMNNFWNKNTIYCPNCDFRMEHTSSIALVKKWNTRKPVEKTISNLEKYKSGFKGGFAEDKEAVLSKAIEIVKNIIN